MLFRTATIDDVPALLALQQLFYRSEGYPYDPPEKEQALRHLVLDPGCGGVVSIERDGAIVGYVVITFGFSLEFGGRDAFVDELYVAPASRGQGLGTHALAAAEEVCREAGVRALHLEVEFGNEGARRLYERSGYHAHTRHLMTKKL